MSANQSGARIFLCVELLHIHVLCFIVSLKSPLPNVLAFDAIVVQHVGRIVVDCNTDFCQVWEGVFSPIPCAQGNKRRMPFTDLLWGLTLMFSLVSVSFLKMTILLAQITWSYAILELDVGQLCMTPA